MFRLNLRPATRARPAWLLRPRNLHTPRFTFFRAQSTSSKPQPKGLKALMKEYGYSALGVYLTLSMLDLPLCYAIVHTAGREKIEYYENKVKQYFGYGKSDEELLRMQEINKIEDENEPQAESEGLFSWFSWTEFAIAYGIHKSVFIFVRVPLTAALTPSIVKTLRRWGFKIGSDKLATTAAIAKDNLASASSAKFGTRPTRKNKWFWFF